MQTDSMLTHERYVSLLTTDAKLIDVVHAAAERRGVPVLLAGDGEHARDVLENRKGFLRIVDCGSASPLEESERRSLRLCGRPTDDILGLASRPSHTATSCCENRTYSWQRKAFAERAETILGPLLPHQGVFPERWLLGVSRHIADIRDQIGRLARYPDLSVMILGETGTGKERVTEAIHEMSCTSGAPLVAVNCAAIPASLFESELFGHEAGSFTGARAPREGLFEVAAEGTIFLDEIAEMPLELQAKLLRALETRQFRRVGGARAIPLRARVVSATHRGLDGLDERHLRADLHYRLAGFTLTLAPLRDRPEDVEVLARHFVAAFGERHNQVIALSEQALELLVAQPWPGNVRELRAAVERGAILARDGLIGPEEIGSALVSRRRGAPPPTLEPEAPPVPAGADLRSVERHMVLQAWETSGFNLSRAARALRIPRNTLRGKLRRMAVDDIP